MSIKGWGAYFKVIRHQPVHSRITGLEIGQACAPAWAPDADGQEALDRVRDNLPTAQYALRKMFVEEGNGICAHPHLHIYSDTPVETRAWILRQLRGSKRNDACMYFNFGRVAGLSQPRQTLFCSELARLLQEGTFERLELGDPFPLPQEVPEALSMSQGLRALSLGEAWYYEHDSECGDLAQTLFSPAATHSIERICVRMFGSCGLPDDDEDELLPCRVWDLLDIRSLKHLDLRLISGDCPYVFPHADAIGAKLRRRAQLRYSPLHTVTITPEHTLCRPPDCGHRGGLSHDGSS